MAILQALKVSSGTEQMPGVGDGQSCKAVASTYTFGAAPTAGDVVQSALIQSGSVIVDVVVINTTTATITVGYGVTPGYHMAAGTATAVSRMSVANPPLVFTTNDTVDVTMAGSGAAGYVTIIVYFLPRNA